MHYVLTGKIAKAHPYQLDKTLTVEGAGAEAKATGEAIKEAKRHAERVDNPHKVTAKQIGLGNVDNTSDQEKPISTAQLEAISNAYNRATNAMEAAENAQTSADDAQTSADNAQTAADEAMSEAQLAKTAAESAQNFAYEVEGVARAKSSHRSLSVVLSTGGWAENAQTVSVEDVDTERDIVISPNPLHNEAYAKSGVYCSAQGEGTLTFKCDEVPNTAIEVNVLILSGSGMFSDAQIEDELLGGES
jgi:hypothetical protein